MPCHKKHEMVFVYSRLSTKEGLFTETTVKDLGNVTEIYIENVNGAIKYSKLKKHLRKMHLCVMSAINS